MSLFPRMSPAVKLEELAGGSGTCIETMAVNRSEKLISDCQFDPGAILSSSFLPGTCNGNSIF